MLAEALGTADVYDAIMLLVGAASGMSVKEARVVLAYVAKSATTGEERGIETMVEAESVAGGIIVDGEVGINNVEDKTMLLECVASCGLVEGSDIL